MSRRIRSRATGTPALRARPLSMLGRPLAFAACVSVSVAVAASAAPAGAAPVSCATGATTIGASGCYTVPAGFTYATFTATGAKGGTGGKTEFQQGGLGGAGGQVSDTLSVTPGEQLTITVGGNGGTGQDYTYNSTQGGSGGAGGANGGAAGGDGGGYGDGAVSVSYGGGGGGGGATTVTDSNGNLVMEAGGGGGGGANGWNDAASGGAGGCGGQYGTAGTSGSNGGENGGLLTQGGETGLQPWGNWSGSNNGSGGAIPVFLAVDATGADGNPPGGGGGGGVMDGSAGGAGGLLWPDGAGNPPFWEYGGGGAGGGSSSGPAGSTFVSCASGGARVEVSNLYGPPQVTGSPATNVTSTSATVNGAVNPFNSSTTYQFYVGDYITGVNLYSPSTPAGAGSDNTYHPESQTVSGLEPNTQYSAGILASNAAGLNSTDDQGQESFTTLPSAPAAVTAAPTSVTGTSATLNGTVNPENSSTTYYFQYGETPSYGTQIPVSAGSVGSDYSVHNESQALSNLTPGQPYYYRIVAVDSTGTSYGAQQMFTTVNVPGAPSDVQASAGDAQATVSFTPPTSGNTPSSYVVTATDQTTPGNGGQTASGSGSPITLKGLTNGDTYTFTVLGKITGGNGLTGGPSNPVTPMATPAAAQSLDAEAGPGEAEVSFDLPVTPSGSPISGLTVTATDLSHPANGGQVVTDTTDNGCNGDPAPYDLCNEYVTGLTNGDNYTFTVTLSNADESGPATAASDTVQPAGPIIRSLSFGGTSGYFVDLYNPAPQAIELDSDWTLNDPENEQGPCAQTPCASGLDLSGLTIPAHGNYLISGSGYSLGADPGAAPDLTTSWRNSYEGTAYGVNVKAPDGDLSDAVGYSNAASRYVSGTGLTRPTDDGNATAFVRRYMNGEPVNTGDNAADFVLTAPDASTATYGGAAELGVASALDSGAPVVHSEFLQASAVPDGVSYTPGGNGQPGQLTVDQTITNCSGQALTGACANASAAASVSVTRLQLQLTSLTTTGSPNAGPGQAVLVPESSTSTTAADSTCAGTGSLALLSPSVSGGGAGLDSIWNATGELPGATSQNPSGGLAAGGCVNVQMSFAVLQSGYYSFGYNALDDLVSTPELTGAGGAGSGSGATSGSGGSSTPAASSPAAAAVTPAASMVTVKGTLTSHGATATVTQIKAKPTKKAKKTKKPRKAKHRAKPRKHRHRGAR